MVFVKNSDEGVFSPHFTTKSIIRAPLIPLIRRLRRHLPHMGGKVQCVELHKIIHGKHWQVEGDDDEAYGHA